MVAVVVVCECVLEVAMESLFDIVTLRHLQEVREYS